MSNEEKVIEVLLEWKNDPSYFGEGVWFGYYTLSDLTNITIQELKKIMKKLAEKKLVEKKHTIDSEEKISGSGWFITDLD